MKNHYQIDALSSEMIYAIKYHSAGCPEILFYPLQIFHGPQKTALNVFRHAEDMPEEKQRQIISSFCARYFSKYLLYTYTPVESKKYFRSNDPCADHELPYPCVMSETHILWIMASEIRSRESS